MGPLPIFTLMFAPQVVAHVRVFNRQERRLIQENIRQELRSLPTLASRRRKRAHHSAPFGATWELRFGPGDRYRVYYEVDPEAKVVMILAVGVKQKDRLLVAGEEEQA